MDIDIGIELMLDIFRATRDRISDQFLKTEKIFSYGGERIE